jgi:signal transduction histidine kinase
MIAVPFIMISATAEDYAGVMSQRVSSESRTLAARWLVRLKEILTVPANEVFASDELLDHIPSLVEEIAAYLCAATDNEIAANAAVMEKARELGVLRHEQRASVHQLLHEYEILGDILEVFLIDETERLSLHPSVAECFQVQHRLTRAVRVLTRTTVDTFVAEYTATIQAQTERIQAFNRAASHELRSPIGTLVFAAALLDTDVVRQDPARLTKVAATVRSSAERLTWLVENLQRIARMGDTIDVPSQQRVDLGLLAAEVARQVEEMAASRGVMIRVADDLPTIVADPAQVELILLNIVSNGIKYADPAKPESLVEIATADASGDAAGASAGTVTIRVRDNGLGIAEADLPTIFDRFFRAHAHLDGELGNAGSGLGLAIVGDCVKALGGTIRCESAYGDGTSFYITLPSSQPGNAVTNG